jgi:ribosomal protein S27E
VQFQVYEELVPTLIPHSEFGAVNCCGCLAGMQVEELAEIVCNECGSLIAYVVGDLRQALNELESRLALANALSRN